MKHNADGICVTGVRMAESIQRSKYMASSFSSKSGLARGNMVWPVYDWKDTDVWRYLYEQKIDIPDIYLYLYQTGSRLNELRVSQFFSVDTAKSLVKMNEYYPDLMDRIIRREPNAYLASLYWDSEMFRRSTKNRSAMEDKKDYKAEVFKLLNDPRKHFITRNAMDNAQRIIQLLIKYGPIIEEREYKTIHDCLVGGDPKQRTLRSLIVNINVHYSHTNKGKTNGK
jgi:predicted phosphoadenosine phosphosulfate sulfurtransferase